MHIKSFNSQQHCYICFSKNLIPRRDSNPGLLVSEADAMSTGAARAQERYLQCDNDDFTKYFPLSDFVN
jgi:hypothetical protein